MIRTSLASLAQSLVVALGLTSTALAEEPTKLLWGDTHLHTKYSFDAFLNGNKTTGPDEAYRWAKGQPVIHPGHRAWIQISRPLDFLVVADHAELMGSMHAMYFGEPLPDNGFIGNIKRWFVIRALKGAIDGEDGQEVFRSLLPKAHDGTGDPVTAKTNEPPSSPLGDMTEIDERTWDIIMDAAERHNDPGKFTAIVGWEWSSVPSGANIHRIVLSPTDGETAKQFLPFGSDQSQYPEDLWAWLQKTTDETGAQFIAIPHNSNISKGYMFAETTLKGEKMTPAYAKLRASWEPIVEITQIKGDSETWPSLSPDDEFADFEAFTRYIQQDITPYAGNKGDFIRPALRTGLEIENQIGVNPFKFGVIGSTDAHTGISSAGEDNFHGKMAKDSIPENKYDPEKGLLNGWVMSASGMAAVYAKENTREEIFAAMKRRETFATTGPRIGLRVFGGYGFGEDMATAENMVEQGYAGGVPMGGDLLNDSGKPVRLAIRAVKDPIGANLDRVQVVKGWLDANGTAHEKIYNVAWSDNRELGADGSLPPVGNTVDLNTARAENTIGAAELATVWQDPDFDASQKAFYYVRVIQIPTARNSLYDTIALNQPHDESIAGPATIQERAYSSPIWYTP